jgi:hypothetical protein
MDIGFGMRLVRRIDFYACWLARGNINEAREMRTPVPRRCTNVAFLVGLVAAVAASANFPVLVSSIFWRNMTTRGAVVGVSLGLNSAVLLTLFSKSVWVDVLHHAHAPVFLDNPRWFQCRSRSPASGYSRYWIAAQVRSKSGKPLR